MNAGVEPGEPLEDGLSLVGGDARAVVRNGEHRVAGTLVEMERDVLNLA